VEKAKKAQSKWHPQPPTLDLNNDPVLAKPPDAIVSQFPQDTIAWLIGQQLQPILKEVQLTTLAGIRIVDSQGTIIASTGHGLGASLLNRIEVEQALAGYPVRVLRQRISDEPRPMLTSISRGTGVRIFLAHPIIIQQRIAGAVILSRTPPDIFQVLYAKRFLFSSYGLLLLLLVILIAWFTSFSITKPIQALVKLAQRASEGEYADMPTLAHPIIDEIQQLSQALNKMVEKQNQRAAYIKNFASHVSHEFKTPITAIKGALEILNDHRGDMSTEEIEQFLTNIDKDTYRMQQLMQRLTQLAKADVVVVTDTAHDILEILNSLACRYKDKISISISMTSDSPRYPILMARELIETIFINLIENSVQHNGKKITIQITPKVDQIEVSFSDNGSGISNNNSEKVFQPFFTTTRQAGGTGLGLAITKTLLQAHAGDIKLLSGTRGCTFIMTFNSI